jgi:hypothetical protein
MQRHSIEETGTEGNGGGWVLLGREASKGGRAMWYDGRWGEMWMGEERVGGRSLLMIGGAVGGVYVDVTVLISMGRDSVTVVVIVEAGSCVVIVDVNAGNCVVTVEVDTCVIVNVEVKMR